MTELVEQKQSPVALVVDDDVTIRMIARESMELLDFTVVEAENGLQGDLGPSCALYAACKQGN